MYAVMRTGRQHRYCVCGCRARQCTDGAALTQRGGTQRRAWCSLVRSARGIGCKRRQTPGQRESGGDCTRPVGRVLPWRVARATGIRLFGMASQPTTNGGDESLEELDLDDAAVISHQSEAHAPARRQAVQVDEPSVVVADHAEPDVQRSGARQATTRRGRRALEPTLLIRDRRQADELRAEMDRRVRQLQRERLRSTLTWAIAGLFAFALGGLIALLVSQRKAGERPASVSGDAPSIERAVGETQEQPAGRKPRRELETIDLDAPQ